MMLYIMIDDQIYTAHEHALERIAERKVAEEWIERALRDPDDMDISLTGRMVYDKLIPEASKILRVVVQETSLLIITSRFTG